MDNYSIYGLSSYFAVLKIDKSQKKRDGFKGQKSIVLPDAIIGKLRRNPLTRLLYVTDIGYYPKAKFHFRKRPHGVDQHILIYCVDGEEKIEISQSIYHLTLNQYIIIPQNMAHKYSPSTPNPWTMYWLHFAGEKPGLFINPTAGPYVIGAKIRDRDMDKIFLFEEIYQNLSTGYS